MIAWLNTNSLEQSIQKETQSIKSTLMSSMIIKMSQSIHMHSIHVYIYIVKASSNTRHFVQGHQVI